MLGLLMYPHWEKVGDLQRTSVEVLSLIGDMCCLCLCLWSTVLLINISSSGPSAAAAAPWASS